MISICRGVLQYAPTTHRSLSLFACPRTEKFTFCKRLITNSDQKVTTSYKQINELGIKTGWIMRNPGFLPQGLQDPVLWEIEL
jgi:hypothetical protein